MVDKSSHSEVENFLGCERRHYYTYGLKIQGKTASDNLIKGSVGHLVLATYYQARMLGASHVDAMRQAVPLIRSEVEAYEPFDEDKIVRDLMLILRSYWNEFEQEKWNILHVELGYTIRLIEDYEMPVKIDLIAEIPGHGVVALDHKFSTNFLNVDKLDLNPQLPKYWAALEALNIKVDELWYNELRTLTTKDNTADPSLRFRRTPITMTSKKIVTIMREQIMAARRISRLKSLPVEEWETLILRNSQACNMCAFNQLCSSDLEGGQDSNLIIEAYYEPRSYK